MATARAVATFCPSGGHINVTLTVNAVTQGQWSGLNADDFRAPITEDEKLAFVKLLVRLHAIGKTPAQLRADAIAGITVTTTVG